ncbi:MAG TPA: hypothetical protein PLH39_08660 [Promineifilum sp.]|nr:hypothetical protein [Promineifilum sp.]
MPKRILLAFGLVLLVACGGRAAVGPAATFPPEATADGRQPTAAPTTTAAPAVFLPVLPGGAEATTADDRPPTAAPTTTADSGQPTAESAPAAPPPTPYVSNIPDFAPRPELGPSKLGIHVARPNSPAILAFVRAAHPAVVKGVDDLGFLAEVKAASPGTVTIGRLSVENQDYGGEPEAAAAALVAAQLPQLVQHPSVDYWEGWNEPDPNLDRMAWYARFEAERVRQLAAHGLRAAVGGFSAGVPELDEFALFVPAIEAAKAHGGILTLHEYAAPDLTFLYGDPLPGYPTYPDRGPLMFRYRWFYRDVLEPRGLVVPLVISEAGIDGILGNRPGPQGLGWQDFQEFWVAQGWGPDGQTAFLNQLQWLDNEARQDDYLIGYALFTAGGGRAWETYELDSFLPRLAEYVVSQKP